MPNSSARKSRRAQEEPVPDEELDAAIAERRVIMDQTAGVMLAAEELLRTLTPNENAYININIMNEDLKKMHNEIQPDEDATEMIELAGALHTFMKRNGSADARGGSGNDSAGGGTDFSPDSVVTDLHALQGMLDRHGLFPEDYVHRPIIDGVTKAIKQQVINQLADENRDQITGDKISSLCFKTLNDPKNTFDPTKAYHGQMTGFATLHSSTVVTYIIKTAGADGYTDYTALAFKSYLSTQNPQLILKYPQYNDICNGIVTNLDRWVLETTGEINDISRSFQRLNVDDPVGPLAARLKILVEMSQTNGRVMVDEEREGIFFETRFREQAMFDGPHRTVKTSFEAAGSYLNRLIDAQSAANSGRNSDNPLIDDSDVVKFFRCQVTSRGIGLSAVNVYDSLLYRRLIEPIQCNRTSDTTHANTTSISTLTALCASIYADALRQGWVDPNGSKQNSRSPRRPVTQPQLANAVTSVATGTTQPQLTVPQGYMLVPQPSATAHTSLLQQQPPPPPPPPAVAPNGHAPRAPRAPGNPGQRNPRNCFRCDVEHTNEECPRNELKVGPSPHRGKTGPDGKHVCLTCGNTGHPMRSCGAPGLPVGMTPGTIGYSYHSLGGPKFAGYQGANVANGNTKTSRSSSHGSQSSQQGNVASPHPARTVRGTDFDMTERDDDEENTDTDSV